MNKKKLPKVIVSRDSEAPPAPPPNATATEAPLDHTSTSSKTTSEPASRGTENVVQMIRPAVSISSGGESKMAGSPQVAMNSAVRRSKAHAIVDRYAAYSAVGGLAPLAIANFAAITAIILRMVKVLCKHYGVPFRHDRARAVVIALIGGAMPTGAAVITTSTLLYLAPPAALVGAAVSSVTAAVFTRRVGRVFIAHFEDGAPLEAFSA